jgi:hypothetical protein
MTCDSNGSSGPQAPPSGAAGSPFSRSMEDAITLAVVTGLLSTIVQSLMSHMANSSANHQATLTASSHSSIAGLATVAKAVDQILGGGNGNGSSSPQPMTAPMMHSPGPQMSNFAQAAPTNPFTGPPVVS